MLNASNSMEAKNTKNYRSTYLGRWWHRNLWVLDYIGLAACIYNWRYSWFGAVGDSGTLWWGLEEKRSQVNVIGHPCVVIVMERCWQIQ